MIPALVLVRVQNIVQAQDDYIDSGYAVKMPEYLILSRSENQHVDGTSYMITDNRITEKYSRSGVIFCVDKLPDGKLNVLTFHDGQWVNDVLQTAKQSMEAFKANEAERKKRALMPYDEYLTYLERTHESNG